MPKPPCEAGRARDLTTGECLAHRETRAIAASVGVLVEEDTVLSCDGAFVLASGVADNAPRLGCLPPASSPPLHEAPALVDKRGIVDVVAWTRAYLSGPGSPLCGALQDSPGALVVAASVESAIQLELSFPDNDVSQLVVAARANGPGGFSQGELDHALAPLTEALRSVGGTANQAFVSMTATCRRTSERPRTSSAR